MDSKKDIKPDLLADVNLPSLMQRRAESVERQKEAAANVETGKAGHFLRFWLGGGIMLFIALWLAETLDEYSPLGMFLLSGCIILWLGMWIAAFFSGAAVMRLQNKARAANRQVVEIDEKIAFCHQVLEAAKTARVQKYAQALIEKEASK